MRRLVSSIAIVAILGVASCATPDEAAARVDLVADGGLGDVPDECAIPDWTAQTMTELQCPGATSSDEVSCQWDYCAVCGIRYLLRERIGQAELVWLECAPYADDGVPVGGVLEARDYTGCPVPTFEVWEDQTHDCPGATIDQDPYRASAGPVCVWECTASCPFRHDLLLDPGGFEDEAVLTRSSCPGGDHIEVVERVPYR